MSNDSSPADQIETILSTVVSEGSALDPSPASYFMLFNPEISDSWILGFLFDRREDLRTAIENGVCYQIHQYVTGALERFESEVDRYIVFDSGVLPENESKYRELHEKFAAQLDLLQQDKTGGEFSLCGLCGHGADQHQLRGWTQEGQPSPTEGWMICPDESCTCFRTWSLGAGTADKSDR